MTATSNLIGDQNLGSGSVGNVFGGLITANAEKLEGHWAHTKCLTDNLSSDHPYKLVTPKA